MAHRVGIAEGLRGGRFEQECERLRPLGQAYLVRRFGGQINSEDAEDAVSEVIIRLYQRDREGRRPENLRAAFFTSVRNQAIDTLRARGARPHEVALEAAAAAPSDGDEPADVAESLEEAAVLREALARMRSSYREAIVLRFGVGMTVPEIAEHRGISLPAAKKLILRATKQVKDKLLAVTSPSHCEEMQEFARRSLFEKYATDLATAEEATLVRKHLDHCGHCKAFLVNLHHNLHELAGGALFAGAVSDQLTSKAGVIDHLSNWASGLGETSQVASEKARLAAFKAGNAIQGSDAAAGGALAGTGQKIVAVCGAGAATAATCLATGVVGPGIPVPEEKPKRPAKVETVPDAPAPAPLPVDRAPGTVAERPPAEDPRPSAQEPPSEFGLEGGATSSSGGGGSGGGGSGGGGSGGGGSGGGGSGGGEFDIE